MDKKLRETTNLGIEIRKKTVNDKKEENWSRQQYRINSRLPFDVNMMLTSVLLTFSFMQPVGCDYKIGSGAAYDRCGVCNGDSTTCTPVTVTFTEDWKERGE